MKQRNFFDPFYIFLENFPKKFEEILRAQRTILFCHKQSIFRAQQRTLYTKILFFFNKKSEDEFFILL
jgi:hypothetical protein